MLDRGSCRRKQVVRYPTRGYQADQPSLTHATRPPNLLALDDHIHIRRLLIDYADGTQTRIPGAMNVKAHLRAS